MGMLEETWLYLKKNRFLLGAVLFEFLFLLILTVRLLQPSVRIEINGSELIKTGSWNTAVSGESQEVTAEEGEVVSSGKVWETSPVRLEAGAYHVEVIYESRKSSLQEIKQGNYGSAGWCFLSSETDNDSLRKDTVWIKTGSVLTDLKMVFHYNGEGSLRIDKVVFTESRVYKLTRLVAALLLFGLFDALYMVFWGNGKRLCIGRKEKGTIAVLLGIIIFSSLPLFIDGLADGHDIEYHLERILALSIELKNGQFPVRMQGCLLDGYGYASSLLYGDIFLYIPAVLHILYVPLQDAYKIYVILVNTATCIVAWYCFRKISSTNWIGLFSSFCYTLSAYRLVNIYVRAAVGEYSAMVFFPLLFLGIWNILTAENKERIRWHEYTPLSVGFAGLIQTHVLSCELAGLFVIFALIGFWKRTFRKNTILALLKAGILGLSLSLWFLAPFLEYMQEDLKVFSRTLDVMQISGAYLAQILNPLFPGTGDNVLGGMTAEMPLSLGLLPVAGLFLYFWYRSVYGVGSTQNERIAGTVSFLAVLAIGFSLPCFPWDTLKNMSGGLARYVCVAQFPWRYLAIATVLLTGVLAIMIRIWSETGKERLIREGSVILGSISMVITCSFYMNYLNQSGQLSYYNEQDIGLSQIGAEEYMPSRAYSDAIEEREAVADEGVLLDAYERYGDIYTVQVYNSNAVSRQVRFPVLYYKDYRVINSITGENFPITESGKGTIEVEIPGGFEGKLTLRFVPPIRWRVAEAVSVLSFLAMCIYSLRENRRRKAPAYFQN